MVLLFSQFKAVKRIGVAVGEQILDLGELASFYPENVRNALRADSLNPLMELGYEAWGVVRTITRNLLLTGSVLDGDKNLQAK